MNRFFVFLFLIFLSLTGWGQGTINGGGGSTSGTVVITNGVVVTNGVTSNGQVPISTNNSNGYFWGVISGGGSGGNVYSNTSVVFTNLVVTNLTTGDSFIVDSGQKKVYSTGNYWDLELYTINAFDFYTTHAHVTGDMTVNGTMYAESYHGSSSADVGMYGEDTYATGGTVYIKGGNTYDGPSVPGNIQLEAGHNTINQTYGNISLIASNIDFGNAIVTGSGIVSSKYATNAPNGTPLNSLATTGAVTSAVAGLSNSVAATYLLTTQNQYAVDLTSTNSSNVNLSSAGVNGALFGQSHTKYIYRLPRLVIGTYNNLGTDVSFANVSNICLAVHNYGLDVAGWKTIVIDDGWCVGHTNIGGTNYPVVRSTFPSPTEPTGYGLKPIADYAHSLGLDLGIYVEPTYKTSAGYYGMDNYEFSDAAYFTSVGVKYYKYDSVTNGTYNYEKLFNFTAALNKNHADAYLRINASPAMFVYNNSLYYNDIGWISPYLNSVQVQNNGDTTSYAQFVTAWQQTTNYFGLISPGSHLTINGIAANHGSTQAEAFTQFALNCMASATISDDMAAPNYLLPNVDAAWIPANVGLMAIDQDEGVNAPYLALITNNVEIWVKPLGVSEAGRSYAVAFWNTGSTYAPTTTVSLGQLGIPYSTVTVDDVFKDATLFLATNYISISTNSFTYMAETLTNLSPHMTTIWKISPGIVTKFNIGSNSLAYIAPNYSKWDYASSGQYRATFNMGIYNNGANYFTRSNQTSFGSGWAIPSNNYIAEFVAVTNTWWLGNQAYQFTGTFGGGNAVGYGTSYDYEIYTNGVLALKGYGASGSTDVSLNLTNVQTLTIATTNSYLVVARPTVWCNWENVPNLNSAAYYTTVAPPASGGASSIDTSIFSMPQKRVNAVTNYFYGDSITAGSGGAGTTWPNVYSTLSGIVSVNRGYSGATAYQIATNFFALETADTLLQPHFFEMGQNNTFSDTNSILTNISSVVAACEAVGNTNLVILSIVGNTNVVETPTSDRGIINRQIQERWPKYYVPAFSLLASNYNNPNETWFTTNGIVAPSLRSDGTHLNSVGYTLLASIVFNARNNHYATEGYVQAAVLSWLKFKKDVSQRLYYGDSDMLNYHRYLLPTNNSAMWMLDSGQNQLGYGVLATMTNASGQFLNIKLPHIFDNATNVYVKFFYITTNTESGNNMIGCAIRQIRFGDGFAISTKTSYTNAPYSPGTNASSITYNFPSLTLGQLNSTNYLLDTYFTMSSGTNNNPKLFTDAIIYWRTSDDPPEINQ